MRFHVNFKLHQRDLIYCVVFFILIVKKCIYSFLLFTDKISSTHMMLV